MHVYKCKGVKVCKYACMQVFKPVSMQVCKCASMPTSRNGHLPSLGWSPTNPRMVTLQKEFVTKLNPLSPGVLDSGNYRINVEPHIE